MNTRKESSKDRFYWIHYKKSTSGCTRKKQAFSAMNASPSIFALPNWKIEGPPSVSQRFSVLSKFCIEGKLVSGSESFL